MVNEATPLSIGPEVGCWIKRTFADVVSDALSGIDGAGVISLHRSFDDMQSCTLNSH